MSRRVTNLLFPTPVWRIDLEASEELNATLLGQLKDVDWSAKARESEMRFGASHTFAEDRFVGFDEAPAIEVVTGCFIEECREIAAELGWRLGARTIDLASHWVHRTEPGGRTMPHTHKPAVLSGVYYVQKPVESGDVVFIDENPYHGFAPSVDHRRVDKRSKLPLGGAADRGGG